MQYYQIERICDLIVDSALFKLNTKTSKIQIRRNACDLVYSELTNYFNKNEDDIDNSVLSYIECFQFHNKPNKKDRTYKICLEDINSTYPIDKFLRGILKTLLYRACRKKIETILIAKNIIKKTT